MARSYAKLEGALDFDRYMDQIKAGRSYVSDGKSHIVDFFVQDRELGTHSSELRLDVPSSVKIRARVAAYLPSKQDEVGAIIAGRDPIQPPYWDIERARIGKSRKVPVELVVNGEAVARKEITATGEWVDLAFEHEVSQSSWVALRVLSSSHTNPVFVIVANKPVRASLRSAEWCRRAVDRCWMMKEAKIREDEQAAAKAAYDHARNVYDRILLESTPE